MCVCADGDREWEERCKRKMECAKRYQKRKERKGGCEASPVWEGMCGMKDFCRGRDVPFN